MNVAITSTSEDLAQSDAEDVLVFEHLDGRFTLVHASGRRAGWVGIVDADDTDSGLVGTAWRRGTPERRSTAQPIHVVGPYYAASAVAVPVGQRHVVVFGSPAPIMTGDSRLIRSAVEHVDEARGATADKLLADELELVHALRELMAYRPTSVRDTVRHVAGVAGRALSCEVAVVRIDRDGESLIEGLDLRSSGPLEHPDPAGYLAGVGRRARVEQIAPVDPDLFGVSVASHMILPLGGESRGALALGHASTNARGFTSLCQRIGRAIADAADLLISQAATREQLAAELDQLEGLVHTDPLTGVRNRRGWDDEAAGWRADVTHPDAVVLSIDLDGLKDVNDRYGHASGDALIRGAANLLRSSVRGDDVVARVGGDEFVVLLAPADQLTAKRVVARIRRAERVWRVSEHGLAVRLSLGLAPVLAGDLDEARQRADARMYLDKQRRRGRREGKTDQPARADRRRTGDTAAP